MLTPPIVYRNVGTTYVARDVTLVTGRVVLSDSEEWRHQCEAQHILNRPSKNDRLRLLSNIQERRGLQARQDLQATILALWKAGQQADVA